MLKISYAGYLGLSPAISLQFSGQMCAAFKNCKKFTKTPFWGVQGRSRSSTLINLKSLSPVLVMTGSMSVPNCDRFHTTRANISKITSFKGVPLFWRPCSRRAPSTHGHEILSLKIYTYKKIFRTKSTDTVNDCMLVFNCSRAEDVILKR